MANWGDGAHMWDTMNPLDNEVLPGIAYLVTHPKLADRNKILNSCLAVCIKGMTIVNRYPHRLVCPQVVIRALGSISASLECALGDREAGYKGVYETYGVYGLINLDNFVTRRAMQDDLARVSRAAIEGHWQDDTPIEHQNLWNVPLWPHGEPARFRSDLKQKTSFWRLTFTDY
jgi:hypothetical protein